MNCFCFPWFQFDLCKLFQFFYRAWNAGMCALHVELNRFLAFHFSVIRDIHRNIERFSLIEVLLAELQIRIFKSGIA